MELSNIPEIDKEHNEILADFTVLHDKESLPYDKVLIRQEFEQLLAKLEHHFTTEENIMYRVKYFDTDGHAKTHSDLLYLIRKTYTATQNNPDQLFHAIGLVHKWVFDHISIESSLFRKLISQDLTFRSRQK